MLSNLQENIKLKLLAMPDKKKKYKRIYSLEYGYSHNCIYTYKLKYTKISQTYIVKVTEMLKNTQRTI